MTAHGTDVAIVGGGVIGLSLAYELAGQGVSVRVVERAGFGQEASWAGAGILPPGNLEGAESAGDRLRALSHRLWPRWSESLQSETGIDNGYHNCGGIAIRLAEDNRRLTTEIEFWQREGVCVEELNDEGRYAIEPALSPDIVEAYRLPELGQVRNPRHLKALLAACVARGVELVAGQPVIGFGRRGEAIRSVKTMTDEFPADCVCICGGAWSESLLRDSGIDLHIEPVRGQIVLLSFPSPVFRHVIENGSRYVVPRPDGRVLIGSTEEWVGFDKRNTAEGVAGLIEFGVSLVPQLAGATLERTWSGLRPGTPDGLPFLGLAPGIENLFIAAGHFRSGLQMSPGTAVVMAEMVTGKPTSIDVSDLSVGQAFQLDTMNERVG